MMKHNRRTAALVHAVVAGVLIEAASAAPAMVCGEGVALCGVLTIESGLGPGAYAHDAPSCHGLWPETDAYGTSECVRPDASAGDPTVVYPCYAASGGDDESIVAFEIHEWEKHGECAGARDEADYFDQVCALAQDPIATVAAVRAAGGDLDAMASAVEAAGYEVFSVDTANAQLLLSACAPPDRRWTLAATADFVDTCGGWPPRPPPAGGDDDDDDDDASAPGPACVPNEHGPPCASDEACVGVAHCVRCAHSGFCTDVPLPDADDQAAQTALRSAAAAQR